MYKILSVDDEPINQAIVEELLGTQFEVTLASSGEECLSHIDSIKPELILLDVSMPGIDGYDTCRELKKDQNTRHIPIIFVSARSTLEDKIKGYDAGGYDYITKPFNHSELEIKIEDTIKSANHSLTVAEKQSQQTDNITTAAEHFSGDDSTISQFFEASYNSTSLEDLGQLLLKSLRQLQLNCVFQFRCATKEVFNFSTDFCESPNTSNNNNPAIPPMELSLIEQTLDKDRFFDFNHRTIITYPHISLLIKNMPVDDQNCYGELKEQMGTFLAAAELKLEELSNA